MCGIIGYVGRRASKPLLLQGLKRLEYRGYDSAGIALLEDDGLDYTRAVGPLDNLVAAAGPNGSVSTTGLGHTRWATHGGVTEANAHPLTACDERKLAIVLNGIVENYRELREELRRGGPHVHLRDRRRDDRAPARGRVRRRPRRCGARGVPEARGPLHVRRHPPRPSEPARRRAPPDADGRRPRRRRELPRLEPRGVPRRDAPRAVPGRRRDRLDHARRRRDHRRDDGRAGRARHRRDRLGRRRRGALRLRDVHAQGDLRAARRRRRDDRRPRPPRPSRARGARHDRGRAAATCAAS